MISIVKVLLLTCCLSSVGAVSLQEGENPIRKIVGLLQGMSKEIQEEGEKEEKAYDKFMCYCDGSNGSMEGSASEGQQKADELSSKLEASKAEKAQLTQELSDHQNARATAKQDAAKAQNIRTKENEEFVAESTDMARNIKAMKGAVSSLEKGTGAFMQMGSEQKALVQRLVESSETVDDYQRSEITDLLQNKAGMQSTDAIVGMLKAMQEEMEGDLKAAEEAEATAVSDFESLSSAKASEVAASTSAIESKTKRAGEVAVQIVQTQDDLEDTLADVKETQAFLGDLAAQCSAKKAEWSERQTMRAEEVAAVGQAIKILNDDDSLELFKKTERSLVETGMGFLQRASQPAVALRAKHIMVSLVQKSTSHSTAFSLIASALKSKAVDFTKITAMIDGMVEVLASEQKDDDTQLAFCNSEFAKSAQTKKETEGSLASLAASIEEMAATVDQLASEIKSLQAEIANLDKAVAQATEQRKEEHATFLTVQSENQAAIEILGKTKNVLNKFYRPNLYKAPERRELTEEEKLVVSSGGVDPRDAEEAAVAAQEAVFVQVRVATNDDAVPPPPPATFGAYQKKDGKSNGVMALMDKMTDELKTDLTDAEHAEEMAQKDYENLMGASQKSRASAAKSITEKESAKAEWSEKIENAKTEHASTTAALLALNEKIAGLHASCDFLTENASMRKDARTNEIEGLKNAKAVLSGANMS